MEVLKRKSLGPRIWLGHFLIFSLIFVSSECKAQGWSADEIDFLSNEVEFRFNEAFLYSFNGSCDSEDSLWKKYQKQFEVITLPSQYTKTKTATALLALQGSKQVKKAPLMIFIPGAFSNLKDPQTRQMGSLFYQLGYHVLVLPNPWATDFVQNAPVYRLGEVDQEIKTYYELIRQGYKVLLENSVLTGDVFLSGISYGAFVSVGVKAIDQESETPIINQVTTLISPPYNLGKTLNYFDHFQSSMSKTYKNLSLLDLFQNYRKICRLKKLDSIDLLNPTDFKNMKAMTIFLGFQQYFADSAYLYDKVWDLNKIPKAKYAWRHKAWRESVSFQSYLKEFSPHVLDLLNSRLGQISYWKDRAQIAGYDQFRFLLSDDDFMNSPGDWDQEVDTHVLEYGGHFGFRMDSWYSTFINKIFKIE